MIRSTTAGTPEHYCAACKIWVSRRDIKSHKKSQPHIDICKRKGLYYCALCNKAFLDDSGFRSHNKSCHKPGITAGEPDPRATSTRIPSCKNSTNSQPQHGAASPNTLAADLKDTAPEDPRSRANSSWTPLFPKQPQYGDTICGICVSEYIAGETMDSHKRSPRHVYICKARGLYCRYCKKIFNTATALRLHACQPPCRKPFAPTQYHCPKCPEILPTKRLQRKHQIHCTSQRKPRTARKAMIKSEDITNHMLSEEHINSSKSKGLYCHLCELPFVNARDLHFHKTASVEHRSNVRKWGQNSERELVRTVPVGMEFCGICDADYIPTIEGHQHTRSHIAACKAKGLYCASCRSVFPTNHRRQIHICLSQNPSRPTAFRCCDCDLNFPTNSKFSEHLKKGCVLKDGSFRCNPCDLTFSTWKRLNVHLNSKNHKTLKCLGIAICERKFKDFSAIIQHLESGTCISKLNRVTIDGLVRSHDTACVITINDCPTPPVTLTTLGGSHCNGRLPALYEEIDLDEDTEEGGVLLSPATILTPECTPSRLSRTTLTPTGVSTITSKFEFQFAHPKRCPICRRTFASVTGLQMHIASPVHAAPIYHCPVDLLGELGLEGKDKNKKRVFRTLSGLAQHIETRACSSKRQVWEKAIEFLQENGPVLMGEVKLLSL